MTLAQSLDRMVALRVRIDNLNSLADTIIETTKADDGSLACVPDLAACLYAAMQRWRRDYQTAVAAIGAAGYTAAALAEHLEVDDECLAGWHVAVALIDELRRALHEWGFRHFPQLNN